ncbi:hypothetical protein JTE90_026391 [Oedothorax gibbosus]|uniref:ACB domain-containing protein n=1 Tax=Oedothorax gibbosus TaxID=931172 RepID=A0AAV6VGA8_9ARAC|nr:hypothetical protein JTE90_026391 [Oedothorax gibbosus]
MAVANTEEKFLSAVEIIRSLPKSGSIQPSNDTKLKFYSYFKQATEGPCDAPKPSFWEVVNKAKWDAWSRLGNMSREEAMKKYVEEFVRTIQQYSLDDLDDPSLINEYSSLMGPYIEYAPKHIQDNYMLMNGKKTLNNNSEDYSEAGIPSNGNSSKNYSNDYHKPAADYPLNGHSVNGNDSDSDEFSDTLERVNDEDSPEDSTSNNKPLNNNDPLISAKGPNIVNVRGGNYQRFPTGRTGDSASAGPSGNGGNHMPQQPRGSSNQPSASSSTLMGGGGGRRGGDPNSELSSEVGEQLAMAVIRLQHIMEQVVVRLDSLETLLTQRTRTTMQVSNKKSSRWSIFGISPKLAVLIFAWPFIAQYLMYLIRKRQRQR